MIKTTKYWLFLLLPLLIVGGGGWHFREFVADVVTRNPTLNLSILGAIGLAAMMCLARMVSFQKEAGTLTRFQRAYVESGDAQSAAEAIAGRGTYMARLLDVVGGLRGRLENRIDQATLLHELQEIKSAYTHSLSIPQFMSGLMIALGLFGTFVGLLETLQNTAGFISGVAVSGGNADGAIIGLIKGIQGPLAGMGTAFSASLFGLLGSLVVGAMLSSLQSLSHVLVYRARLLIDDIVNTQAAPRVEPESLSAQQVTELAQRLFQYENVAVELYARSRRADIETRQHLTEVVARLAETAKHMTDAVTAMAPLQHAVTEQTQHLARLSTTLKQQSEAVQRMESHGGRIEQAVALLSETGTVAQRSVEISTSLLRQSATTERQVNASHQALALAVQSLTEHHQIQGAALQRIAEAAQSAPGIQRQLEQMTTLLVDASQEAGEHFADVRIDSAHRHAEEKRDRDRQHQLFTALQQLVSERLSKQTDGLGTVKPSPSEAAASRQVEDMLHRLDAVLVSFHSGFEALLKDVWQRPDRRPATSAGK